jgi:hypothetical protein
MAWTTAAAFGVAARVDAEEDAADGDATDLGVVEAEGFDAWFSEANGGLRAGVDGECEDARTGVAEIGLAGGWPLRPAGGTTDGAGGDEDETCPFAAATNGLPFI